MKYRTGKLALGGAIALSSVFLLGCPSKENTGGGESAGAGDAAAGKTIFDTKCLACHSIGKGDVVGPDLKGVMERREAAWVTKWLTDPDTMLKTDAVAKELLKKYKNIPMPNQALSPQDIANVIAFLGSGDSGAPSGPLELAKDIGGRPVVDFVTSECGGCHNPKRLGATGPNITKKRLHEGNDKLGPLNLDSIIAVIKNGRPGTVMPAWKTSNNPIGRSLTVPEMNALGTFIWENEAPTKFEYTLEQMKGTHETMIKDADLVKAPTHKSNMDNLLLVTERENFSVAVIDGDKLEVVAHMKSGARAHGYTFHPNGRFAYNLGRDGWLYKYDLFTFKPAARIRLGLDARGIAISDDGKYLLCGMYIPFQAVICDANTLEPLKIFDTSNVKDPKGNMVGSRICTVNDVDPDKVGPYFLMALKEGGQIWRIDYSKPDFPVTVIAEVGEILHDGFLQPDNKVFYLASQASNYIIALDVATMKVIKNIPTGQMPHPGAGAVWEADGKQYAATPHIKDHKNVIWDTSNMEIVGEVPSNGPGLFVRANHDMKYVWFDTVLCEAGNEITVHEKAAPFKIVKIITDGKHTLHPEPDAHGKYVFVSDWEGGVVRVYDDETLELVKTIEDVKTPTGIFSISRLKEKEGH